MNLYKLKRIVKRVSIGLIIAAIVTFLSVSAILYNTSQNSPQKYEYNYQKLSQKQKTVTRTMKKTGEVQSKIAGKKRNTGGNGTFVEEVSKNHKKDKK